jgi:Flp pilus assembly protein TadG
MPQWNSFPTFSRPLRTRLRQERGQALVEFAVVLPVLVLIILGILYFGRYEDYSNQETAMAEQAARQAAVNVTPGTSPGLQSYIQAQATGELQFGSGDVTSPVRVYIYYPTVNNPGPPGAVGSAVRACVTSTVRFPFLGVAGTTQQITQTATMRIEQLRTAPAPPTGWTPDSTWPPTCPS